ncbi:MAG: AAA family ATPase [Firmicutes bacterium]|nr:AAA family ATPase [Bacillota bacterium]
MFLKAFRVQMYKCIYDSGWIEVSPLTALVGKNESGKTSLLHALYRFNPFRPESYSIEKDWPRGRRKERDENQMVCSVRLELTPEEIDHLAVITGQNMTETIIEARRNYAGKLEIVFPPGVFPDKHHPRDIEEICASIPSLQEPVGDLFREKALEYIQEIRDFAYDGRFSEIVKMFNAKVSELRTVASNPGSGTVESKNEEAFIYNYANQISVISRKLSETLTIYEKAHDYVVKNLPNFVYMSDYRIFSGSADLLQVKQHLDKGLLSEEEKTFLTILELAGLNLEDEIAKENSPHRDQRQYDLDDASMMFTQLIAERWKQRLYEVQFRSDGHYFYTFVKDQRDQALIRLEERSKGFQWFFSFDLMFMNESNGTFKNCVILLDEPGLHLHPNAQKDLIRRMEEYAKSNTLIYTSHLPMLLDLERPESIRILRETENGTVVTANFIECQPEEKQVLEAALGFNTISSYLVAAENLIVQSLEDYWILLELARLTRRLQLPCIDEDVFLVPAGTAQNALNIASLMMGRKLQAAVLLNSDPAGFSAKDKFEKGWLPHFQSNSAKVLLLGDCVDAGNRDFLTEDLFPDDFYLAQVEEVYKKQLAIVGCEHLDLVGREPVAKRVAAALGKYEIKFDKSLVTKAIRAYLTKVQTASGLPEQTREMTQKLFKTIQDCLKHR